MKFKLLFTILLLTTMITDNYAQLSYGTGNPFPENVDADYMTDWTNAGVEGGIPTLAHYIDYTTYNLSNSDLNIEAAIADAHTVYLALGEPVVVKLPSGTVYFNKAITLKSGVILVGGGSDYNSTTKTNIYVKVPTSEPNGGHLINITPNSNDIYDIGDGNGIEVNVAPEMGDISISVVNASTIDVGDYLDLRDSREGHYTSPVIDDMVGQVVKVISKSGITLALEDKITVNHPASTCTTKVYKMTPIKDAGVMNIRLYRNYAGYTDTGHSINMKQAVNCFVSGVYSYNSSTSHLAVMQSSHIEIRGNYFTVGHEYGGGHGYGILLRDRTTNTLVEDNVLSYLRHHVSLDASACRNVIAYNYTDELRWDIDGSNAGIADEVYNAHMSHIVFHGNYAHRNLIEGNSAGKIGLDGWWDDMYPHNSTRFTHNGPFNVILRNKVRDYTIDVYAADYTFILANASDSESILNS